MGDGGGGVSGTLPVVMLVMVVVGQREAGHRARCTSGGRTLPAPLRKSLLIAGFTLYNLSRGDYFCLIAPRPESRTSCPPHVITPVFISRENNNGRTRINRRARVSIGKAGEILLINY